MTPWSEMVTKKKNVRILFLQLMDQKFICCVRHRSTANSYLLTYSMVQSLS